MKSCCCECNDCTPYDEKDSIGICDKLSKYVNLYSIDDECPSLCFEIENYTFDLYCCEEIPECDHYEEIERTICR